jgi:hypothetical protein
MRHLTAEIAERAEMFVRNNQFNHVFRCVLGDLCG